MSNRCPAVGSEDEITAPCLYFTAWRWRPTHLNWDRFFGQVSDDHLIPSSLHAGKGIDCASLPDLDLEPFVGTGTAAGGLFVLL